MNRETFFGGASEVNARICALKEAKARNHKSRRLNHPPEYPTEGRIQAENLQLPRECPCGKADRVSTIIVLATYEKTNH